MDIGFDFYVSFAQIFNSCAPMINYNSWQTSNSQIVSTAPSRRHNLSAPCESPIWWTAKLSISYSASARTQTRLSSRWLWYDDVRSSWYYSHTHIHREMLQSLCAFHAQIHLSLLYLPRISVSSESKWNHINQVSFVWLRVTLRS